MNEDTRFIIKRMDELEARVMSEIKDLQAWKNKVIGTYLAISVAFTLIFEAILKYF